MIRKENGDIMFSQMVLEVSVKGAMTLEQWLERDVVS